MLRWIYGLAVGLVAWECAGAEHWFDLSEAPTNAPPPGFRSAVVGAGKPGRWEVILDEVPSVIAPNTPNARSPRRSVIAQLSSDITDEHFPVLVYDDEVYGDFTFTTRFKIAGGALEQMAGIVFRYQDERNFYVLRASALDNTVRFYEVVNGLRGILYGPKVEIAKGVWQELSVECQGNQIHCRLNGAEIIPALENSSFLTGKIGFWTKSDSISYFTDARVNYVPRETLAKKLVKDILIKHPRLRGVEIFADTPKHSGTQVIASTDNATLGKAAEDVELNVIAKDVSFFGKGKENIVITMPLHDRNGEAIAAVRVEMKPFVGQTEQNAVARALPFVKEMEERVGTAKDLFE